MGIPVTLVCNTMVDLIQMYQDNVIIQADDWLDERIRMAGTGKKFDFHGAYNTEETADQKAKEVGGFIRKRVVNGKLRYFVLTTK
jgi:hypothetical protein